MSRIRANQITNQSADGAPTVQNGLVISGVTTSTTFSGSGASLTNLPSAQLTGALPAISGANLTGITQTTINNNANNRIITGNTGTTLDAESTLTYDGNQLKFGAGSGPTSSGGYYDDIKIDNSDTASGEHGGTGIEFISGNQSWAGLIFSDSDTAQKGYVKYSHIDDYLSLAANGTSYMKITNAGIVSCSNSTTGFLPPKGTTAQRTGIGLTPTGMIRYNTTTNNLELYKLTQGVNDWVNITARSSNFNMNYLVIGGGGAGGGNFRAGGGGAGAYRTNWNSESQGGGESSGASKPVTIGFAYSIVVGAGGAGNAGNNGSAGGQSKFDDITADGGTGGARYTTAAPTNSGNGSGGGGGGHTGTTQPGGAAGTYGYAGGSGSSGAQCGGGGGGAADGGYGYQVGKTATANTGSGGGGSPGDNSQTGGAGGSGIVILRFSNEYTATFTGGITKTEATIGNETVVTITATSDSSQTVTFA